MEQTGILESVVRTPLVELHSVIPDGSARVVVKLENHNPTGSMKDRMALSVVDGALADGRLDSFIRSGRRSASRVYPVCFALSTKVSE